MKGRPAVVGGWEPNPRRRHRQFGALNVRAAEFPCYRCDEAGEVTKEELFDQPEVRWRTLRWRDDAEIFECPECAGRGFRRTAPKHRLFFSWAFFRMGGREWYFPAFVTLWHRDPEVRGDDDSCRRPYERRVREARTDGSWLREAWWGWALRHYGLVHVHHWWLQVHPLQALRRRLLTRCAGCGEPFTRKSGFGPISGRWDGGDERWWQGERFLYHEACFAIER